MKRKKLVDLLLGLLIIAALGAVAYGVAFLLQGEPKAGDVTAHTGTAQTETYTVQVSETKSDGSVMDAARIDVKKEAASFPHLDLAGDLYLTTTEDPLYDTMHYTLYDSAFNELYYRSTYFTYPEAAGTYYLVMEAAWGRQNRNFTTQHGVSFTMDAPRPQDQ